MAMSPVLDWRLFPPNQDHKLSQQKLLFAMEALVRANQEELKAHPQIPLLYESGVVYKEEPKGHEDWADIPTVIAQKWGDCEDLAGWMCAELREVWGVPCRPFLRFRKKDGAFHYHAILILPNRYTWDWEIARQGGKALLGPDGQPLVKKIRKPVFETPFVFEDPSLRLGMRGGVFSHHNAYPDILRKASDPLARNIEAQKRLLRAQSAGFFGSRFRKVA